MTVMAQVTIADVVTILAVPIVLQPRARGTRCSGRCSSAAVAALFCGVARAARPRRLGAPRCASRSKQRHWALDLRVSLLVAVPARLARAEERDEHADRGLRRGLMVACVGGPKRLSTQVRGVADGFFIPLFFVVLGARLDLGGLFDAPCVLALAGALAGSTS